MPLCSEYQMFYRINFDIKILLAPIFSILSLSLSLSLLLFFYNACQVTNIDYVTLNGFVVTQC